MISSLALLAVVALWIALAVRDALVFEIEPMICCGIAFFWGLLALIGHVEVFQALGGAFTATIVAGVFYWRGGFGMGDVYLFSTAGFVLGLDNLALGGIIFAVFHFGTVATYAHLRNRSLWRSSAPAAIPVASTVIGVLTLHAYNMPWGAL